MYNNSTTNANIRLKQDLAFGFRKEDEVLVQIKTKFPDAVKNADNFSIHDYCDPTNLIDMELKSRKIKKGSYPTVMLGYNKLCTGRKRHNEGLNKRVIYFFGFVSKDGKGRDLWYWEDDFTTEWDIQWTGSNLEQPEQISLIPMDKLIKF